MPPPIPKPPIEKCDKTIEGKDSLMLAQVLASSDHVEIISIKYTHLLVRDNDTVFFSERMLKHAENKGSIQLRKELISARIKLPKEHYPDIFTPFLTFSKSRIADMCFYPSFSLTFYSKGKIIAHLEFCDQCNHLYSFGALIGLNIDLCDSQSNAIKAFFHQYGPQEQRQQLIRDKKYGKKRRREYKKTR